jgi:hypothetical protein
VQSFFQEERQQREGLFVHSSNILGIFNDISFNFSRKSDARLTRNAKSPLSHGDFVSAVGSRSASRLA